MGNTQELSARFTRDAQTLGVSVEEIKNAWAEGKNLMTLAQEKGIDTETLRTRIKATREADMKIRLDEKVAQGKITRAQADEKITLHRAHESRMETELASVLGITSAQLEAYRNSGKSLDQIITERGLKTEEVHAILKKNREALQQEQLVTQMKKLVADGTITQSQADKKIATIQTQPNKKFGGIRK